MTQCDGSVSYRTIAADPPWPIRWTMGTTRVNGRGERHRTLKRALGYPVMSIGEICELPVVELADDDAGLFLWCPDQFLIEGDGARVVRAWGFDPGRVIVWWAKRGYGLGTFPRPQHEALLVGRRGRHAFDAVDVGSVQEWKQPYVNGARSHSAKPEGAYDLIERVSPGPYLELFARRGRLGWDHWGDQALQTVEMPGL
jgi:N6-adenosine-specific RNA methylase IME4